MRDKIIINKRGDGSVSNVYSMSPGRSPFEIIEVLSKAILVVQQEIAHRKFLEDHPPLKDENGVNHPYIYNKATGEYEPSLPSN